MTKNKILIRLLILILVTVVFISMFYFFFKNSRASSPRNNKEYMEQLTAASKRYNTAGKDVSEIDPDTTPQADSKKQLSFWDRILELFTPSL